MAVFTKLRVAIFGCGWLGQALGTRLIKRHTVMGAVRSEASLQRVQKQHIHAFKNPESDAMFWESDVLVIAISPRHHYLETLEQIVSMCQTSTQQVILLSSTSVYSEVVGNIDETSPTNQESTAFKGETLFKKHFSSGVVVRLGGLMGADRIAGQWGSTLLKDTPVNYIHQDDAVGVLEQVIEQKIQNEIINAVAPLHPKRSAVYQGNCKRFGFALPQFEQSEGKVVLSDKSSVLLNYDYSYKDPIYFWPDN